MPPPSSLPPRCLAIVTAKGRSRRLPGKNIRPFFGHPILKYPVDAALKSGVFETVMVSTDDPAIADVARSYGAEVPFYRSDAMAQDHVMLYEVVEEVLTTYQQHGKTFDYFCCMLPTAVFITPEKLRTAFQRLQESPDAEGIFTVVRFSDPIERALRLNNGCVEMVWPEYLHTMSNDLEPRYHDGGQFWWMSVSALFEQHRLYPGHALGFEIPESEAVDLDTEEDWKMTELKYQFYLNRQTPSPCL